MNLKELSQEELKDKIINKEVTVADVVDAGICPTCFDKENNHVLYGDNAGSKLTKAQALGVKLITEDEFEEMIKNG